jgi:uncharacterized protein (TIGR02466 family)
MARTLTLFVTHLYRAQLPPARARRLNADLARAALSIAKEDVAGRRWGHENAYPGYTSYASLDDLASRNPAFAELQGLLDPHVAEFIRALQFDLQGRRIALDSLWINVLEPGGTHSGHIHPHSVVSGTYYVRVPKGSGALKLEDPRLPLMMAAPPRRTRAATQNRSFVYVEPTPGLVLLWESWLRHEVMPGNAGRTGRTGRATAQRISVSFNYGWR